MKLRFQADADLNQRIVAGVRRLEPAMDLQTAGHAMLEGKADPEVLAWSADQGRVLVTHDQKTMPHHFAAFIAGRSLSRCHHRPARHANRSGRAGAISGMDGQ